MKIDEVLKQLNKNVAKADQFKVASDYDQDHFVTKFYSTGSPYLDYKIGGGFPMGRFILLLGGEGSAKTSITLITASNVQKEGKHVVYFDSEQTVDESYYTRFGINKKLFVHRKGKNLEEMLDAAEMFSKSEDVGMIVLDSIPQFTSQIVEEKDASDNNMAVEARKYNARMPIIYGNCARRGIALVGINFYKLDPMALGDPRKIPRGEWQKYMSSLTIEFAKKNANLLNDSDNDIVGVDLVTKILKSKIGKASAKDDFKIRFFYDFGFSYYDEWVKVLEETKVIEKGGAWYKFPNGEKAQGLTAAAQFLESNPEYLEELILESKINQTLKDE